MDDLISRQAAIRWVKTECNPYGKPTLEFESGKKVIEHLKQMPSAQPATSCSEIPNSSDCISRQKAIDALKNSSLPYVWQGAEIIQNLPTIQPEVLACGNGELVAKPEPTDIDAREAVYNLAEKIGIHQLYALTVELRGEPIQPEPPWIPVGERLPEDLSEVNVTWVNHNPEPYYEFIKDKPFTATAVYYKGKWYWYSATCTDYLAEYGECDLNKVDDVIEIVAWMLLPEPYKPNK